LPTVETPLLLAAPNLRGNAREDARSIVSPFVHGDRLYVLPMTIHFFAGSSFVLDTPTILQALLSSIAQVHTMAKRIRHTRLLLK
jgi:hypothetical protein